MEKYLILNEDCMATMARYPDGYFDLAIVDPPYGIKEHGGKKRHGPKSTAKGFLKKELYKNEGWDNHSPDLDYFKELFRVSKNQIIFGANHFISKIPYDSACWIIWNKKGNDKSDFADGEMAWTSFKKGVKIFHYPWIGFGYINNPDKEKKIHPTHKPVRLYEFILNKFANTDSKILDTHLGGGSIAIACQNYGITEFVGVEINTNYFNLTLNRLSNAAL